ncbi:hypothetical protein ACC786_13705 [Rhizobium ruizarguesonis]|uniref:hypothetical protein n=1 Tax=Rhizobium ruizarguesonis TaxID=2081791 RepID=UPI00103264C6|nr:hypothetical protein [Rhizobium ruizarguesonis]TAT96182.1 hypothetical protein ELI55_27090 [Rhizobium ruizarguesonis]
MDFPTHPERFAKRTWSVPAHRDTDLARRQGNITEVFETWSNGGGSLIDINAFTGASAGPDDVPVGELGLDDNVYIHFGREQEAWLSREKDVFIDGLYMNKRDFSGRSGYFLTLVTDRLQPSANTEVDDACIACGWIDGEVSVDDAMSLFGLWGDSVIVASVRRFEIEFLVGKAISAMTKSLNATPTMVTSRFH